MVYSEPELLLVGIANDVVLGPLEEKNEKEPDAEDTYDIFVDEENW